MGAAYLWDRCWSQLVRAYLLQLRYEAGITPTFQGCCLQGEATDRLGKPQSKFPIGGRKDQPAEKQEV